MQKELLPLAEQYAKQNKRQSVWRRIVRVMACVVVFCTTYALILPAITMERPLCALEEHTHCESCYVKQTTRQVTRLICSYETLEIHAHTQECRDANQELVCGTADFAVHEHNGFCYDGNGTLVCPLPEIKEHEHDEDCYQPEETQPEHTHEDSCYTVQLGELICDREETEGHTHGETCSEMVLACELTVEPHVHGEGCYQPLVCELPEDETHTHSEECSGLVLDCEVTEQEHIHADACYQTNLLCDLPETESHAHISACYESLLICELSGDESHVHSDSCYGMVSVLTCELDAADEEIQEATEPVLICQEAEIKLHTHDENACYEAFPDENEGQKRLICEKFEVKSHVHSESCFVTEEVPLEDVETLTCMEPVAHVHGEGCYDEAGELVCAEPTEGHTHGEQCYGTWVLVCGLEEHTHVEECFPVTETEPEPEQEEFISSLYYPGEDYEVFLRFEETAGIPAGARLEVTELTGEAYREYLERTYEAVDLGGTRTEISFGGGEGEETSVVSGGGVTFARFFDLSIMVDGQKIEPEDVVEVTIRYDETVEIPEGEKTAVHFTDSGEVEVLSAEKAAPMTLRMTASQPEEETEPAPSGGDEFVFFQDSFSVTGTVTLATSSDEYEEPFDQTLSVDWPVGELRTISIMAKYDDLDGGKSITVKVPTGYTIRSYSATEATSEISGVQKVAIDQAFVDYVLSSELGPASLQGSIAGVSSGNSWTSQAMKGYTKIETTTEQNVRTHGGDIVYQLSDQTQHVILVLTLDINHTLLSHTALSESMEPIQIITTSAAKTSTTKIAAKATGIPVMNLRYADNSGSVYMASETGSKAGRSEAFPVAAQLTNTLNSLFEAEYDPYVSYIESGTVTLTYPGGVFLEPGTLDCGALGLNDISGLVKNGTTEVAPGHLSIAWTEAENGGGTIQWILTKVTAYHNVEFGAEFTANTDPGTSPSYKAGDSITGFTLTGQFQRNGKTRTTDALTYTRVLVGSGDGKDIRITRSNFTRRDITADFRTEEYDYALGGFNVYSYLNYQNNVFYFENTEGLRITALGIMLAQFESPNHRIKDVTIWTNTGRKIIISGNMGSYYGDIPQTAHTHGYLMALSNTNIGGRADEYITACLFTTHLATNTTYSPQYTFGSFVYYGQFQDGDNDGSREGDVTLRQLWDNTTADQVEAAVAAGSLDALVMINGGENATYAGKPIAATDHTRIGWTNTGVNKVVSSVSNADTGGSEKTFQIGDELKFTTSIYGGQMLGSNSIDQGVLIDPVLVISLPEGMSLDLTSVTATSEAGSYGGSKVYLVQDGEATEKVINGVTWTTYRFKSPEMLALVAEEYHLNNTKDAAENYISATFNVLVDPGCVDYTLSLQDMMMWDVRNTAYEPDTLGTVTASSENGDAAVSGEGNFTIEDKNNLMGHGTKYKLAAGTGEIVIKPNIDLHVDLGIKPVTNQDDSRAVSGFTTYNGLSSSIVSVIPDRYADIRVTYRSTSTTPYYAGTVIYVPIPKKGEDYAKYFENIELDNPVEKQITETFDFTMDLTGHVTLESSQGEKWNTYYALRTVSSNPNDYSNDITNWEPVVQNGGTVDWLIADQVTDWTKVAMVKFVATADVEPEETGAGVMRLHIHNVNDPDGPAVGGGVNYWRGYCEAVIDQNAMTGNWKYTSVVAATPAVETLVGQIFIDGDQDGIFDSSEPGYQPGTKPYAYTVELKKDDGTMAVRNLAVHSDGSFALVDDDGDTEYLPAGSYTLTVRKNADPNFYFANTGSYIGQESTADQWRNNVSSSNGTVATWKLTVSNDRKETVVHRVGIGLKSSVPVTIQGIKTFSNGSLKAGDYAFRMETDTPNAPVDNTLAENRADGSFSFQQLRFEFPGTYVYRITEDRSNPIPGVNYDGHTATVTVQVNQSSTGVLSATVTYNNSEALTDADRAITDRAAFTNAYGYELPETGGAGTTSYTMGGLLIMLMAAAILLYIHSQKRGKEERPSF